MKFLYYKDGHYRTIKEKSPARAWEEAEDQYGPDGEMFQKLEHPQADEVELVGAKYAIE